MSIREQLTQDLKEAMRARDTLRVETIRSVRGAITQTEVDTGKELTDADVLDVIRRLRKQRLESIAQYEEGGREDLVEHETREKEILEGYLPAAPDAATLERVVSELISDLGATSMRDMGKVMQAAKDKLPGADGKELSAAVKAKLSG